MVDHILNSIKVVTLLQICKTKMTLYNPKVYLVKDQFVLKTLSKNQNLTSIKGRNPFANLRKTVIYITEVDLVNDNEYTKFSLILSIRSQFIE